MASELRRQHRDLYLVKERGLARQTARTYDYGIDVIERFSGKDISAIAQSTRHVRTYLAESSDPASTKRIVVAAVNSVAHCRKESPAWEFHEGYWWAKDGAGDWFWLSEKTGEWHRKGAQVD